MYPSMNESCNSPSAHHVRLFLFLESTYRALRRVTSVTVFYGASIRTTHLVGFIIYPIRKLDLNSFYSESVGGEINKTISRSVQSIHRSYVPS